jgi:hypothetical protein
MSKPASRPCHTRLIRSNDLLRQGSQPVRDISFFEWFFLGMPWEFLVVGVVLFVGAAIVSGIGSLFRKDK